MVNGLVANGCKKEAAVAEASSKLGIGRTEIFDWLKRVREPNIDLSDVYPE
jgi:hypothetical protein